MKKIISAILASVTLISAAGCSTPENIGVTVLSSSAVSSAEWLTERLGDSANIIVGTAEDAASYGVSLDALRDDGYVIRKQDGETLIFGKSSDGLDRGVRAYAKNFATEDYVNYTYGEGAKIKSLTIAGNDISDYVIMLPEKSDECHDYTASELQKYIGNACGIYPDIVAYDANYTGRKISLVRVYEEDPLYETHGDEGFTVSVENGDLTVTGGYLRGCMYGAYEVLEKYVGYIFLYDYDGAPGYSDTNGAIIDYLEEADHIDIPEGVSDHQVSPFKYRHHLSRYVGNDIAQDYRAVMRDLGYIKSSGKYNTYGYFDQCGNSLGPFVNGDLFPNIPAGVYQPCFTDEENLEYLVNYHCADIDKKLDAGQKIGKEICSVNIGQADYNLFCMCEGCMEYIVLDGGITGPVLYFTNSFAEIMEEKYGPDLYVGMLAYWGTSRVPKVTVPRHNVQVSYCFYNDQTVAYFCTSHSVDGTECTGNEAFTNTPHGEMFEQWLEITENITVWYYPGHWNSKPFALPLYRNTREDFKYLADMGAYGVYSDNNNYVMTDEKILQYIMPKLAWNPYMSDEEYETLIKDYYKVMCGDGWEYVYEYHNRLESYAKDTCWSTFLGDHKERNDFIKIATGFLYDVELFDTAISLANTDLQEEYVTKLFLQMCLTGLSATHTDWYINGTDAERADYMRLFDRFIELGTEYDFLVVAAWRAKQKYTVADLRDRLTYDTDILTLLQELENLEPL